MMTQCIIIVMLNVVMLYVVMLGVMGLYLQHLSFFSAKEWPNRLECLSLTRLSRRVLCNALAYWALP
jgi:hypothetical protein